MEVNMHFATPQICSRQFLLSVTVCLDRMSKQNQKRRKKETEGREGGGGREGGDSEREQSVEKKNQKRTKQNS